MNEPVAVVLLTVLAIARRLPEYRRLIEKGLRGEEYTPEELAALRAAERTEEARFESLAPKPENAQ